MFDDVVVLVMGLAKTTHKCSYDAAAVRTTTRVHRTNAIDASASVTWDQLFDVGARTQNHADEANVWKICMFPIFINFAYLNNQES